jgi:hypothetical protein
MMSSVHAMVQRMEYFLGMGWSSGRPRVEEAVAKKPLGVAGVHA